MSDTLLDHPSTRDEPATLRRHRFDVTDYYRMADAGIFDEDSRVELIEGEIIDMAPIGEAHAGGVNRLNHFLVRMVGDRAVVSIQNPVRLDNRNEPQPDFAVLAYRSDFYSTVKPTPANVLLLIEVADTTLRFDRTVKLPLYARHGIREVWIIDLVGQRVEVCRDPEGERYTSVLLADKAAVIAPSALPDARLEVRTLFD